MYRNVLWAAGLVVGTGCAGAPGDEDSQSPDLSPTPAPELSGTPASEPAATPQATPFPAVHFEIVPAEISVPLGGSQAFVAANYGVPVEGAQWQFQYNNPDTHGNFDSGRGIYNAPEASSPGSIGLSVTWTDPDGVDRRAEATIHVSNWMWMRVGGPGPGCGTCPLQVGTTGNGMVWANRPGEGIWAAEPSFISPSGVGGGGPNCGGQGEDPTRVTAEAPPPPDPARAQEKGLSGDWRQISGPWEGDHSDLQLFPMAEDVSELLALTGGILYRSPDGGYTWIRLPIVGEVTAVAPYPGSSLEVMVAVERASGERLLGRSVDGGQSFGWWPSTVPDRVEVLSHVPQLNVRVLAASQSGLFISNDEGLTFDLAMEGPLNVRQLQAWPLAVAWAISEDDVGRKLLRSRDGGATWQAADLVPGCEVTSLARDPYNAEHFMVGCLGGYPQETFDGGDHFNLSNYGLPPDIPADTVSHLGYADITPVIHMRYDQQDHFYFFANVDGWLPLSPGPGPHITSLRSGYIRRPDSDTELGYSYKPGLLVGNEAGWVEMTDTPDAHKWSSYLRPFVGVDVAILDISYSDEAGMALISTESGVYGADRVEGAWSRVQALGADQQFEVVEVHALEVGTAWAGTSQGEPAPFYAAVEGQWQEGDVLPAERLRSDVLHPGQVYALAKGAVWFSPREGTGWSRLDLGAGVEVYSLESGPEGVLAGSSDGIWLLQSGDPSPFLMTGQVVQALCPLPDDELDPDLPPGYAAVVDGELMGQPPGARDFSLVDGFNYAPPAGGPMEVKEIQPQNHDRGLFYALLEDLGLFLVAPAPFDFGDDPGGELGPTCPPLETETPRQ